MARQTTNQLRIVGGAWRSRRIRFADALGLRPTPDRVRETVFNWLGQDLSGLRCLDLFAGSGAFGFEALSRGAASVDMVEPSRAVQTHLRKAAAELGAGERLRLLQTNALEFLRVTQAHYDVVFLDPPYGSGLLDQVMPALPDRLAPDAAIYVEPGGKTDWAAPWEVLKSARAGAVHYYLLRLGRP